MIRTISLFARRRFSGAPLVKSLFHEDTCTSSYVVSCETTGECAIIDPVLDYDATNHRISDTHAQTMNAYIVGSGLAVKFIIETHIHADHLTSSQFFKEQYPAANTVIGFNVPQVQKVFKRMLNLSDLATDGSQFDYLMQSEEEFCIGKLKCRAMYTPGHTPACMTYIIGNAVFVGDTLFMPDYGTARCDFPGGSASALYDSIQNLFALPGDHRVLMAHDYKAPGRDFAWETTMEAQRTGNRSLNCRTPKEEFIAAREERDKGLDFPRLIMQSLQVNLRGGRMPPKEDNGRRYFKLPIN